MVPSVLIYGATGYSGKLIAAAAARQWVAGDSRRPARVVLASRNESELRQVCGKLRLEGLALALDNRDVVIDALRSFHVVINAAGPFALTANRLAKAALAVRCHYVDINGETDVYRRLDDLGYMAHQRDVALVCGAGALAAASDYLLERALKKLRDDDPGLCELGAIRIAMPRLETFSRGSALTALRWAREKVPVARWQGTAAPPKATNPPKASIQYIPVGQLERSFDFGGNRRIASAVALIDVMTAMRTTKRNGFVARTIEAYMAMPAWARAGYNWGAIGSAWLNLSPALRWMELVANQLPDGPTSSERWRQRHTVLLEIENVFHETIIDWRLDTPNSYDFTAATAVAVADELLDADKGYSGWLTPAELLSEEALPGLNVEHARLFAQSGLKARGVRR